MPYTDCPECGQEMYVEQVHNGIAMVWHGVHCGYGQAYFANEDVRKEAPHGTDAE